MTTRIYIDGVISGPEDAKISIFDRGFLYGDSVYEVMRTAGGTLVDLERHLQRLQRSGDGLALGMPKEEELRVAVSATLAEASNPESYLRIVVTRGTGDVGLDPALASAPTLIVIAKALELPTAQMYEQGVNVRLVNVQRTSAKAMDPSVKSGNYLNNILALAEARRSGDYEAIMCDREGWIAEGSSSNIFMVEGDTICTPNLSVGLLAGITRQRVLELAKALDFKIEESKLSPERLRGADEAFLTSSIRGVLPIAQIDGEQLSAPAPGPTTMSIMAQYETFLGRVATAS